MTQRIRWGNYDAEGCGDLWAVSPTSKGSAGEELEPFVIYPSEMVEGEHEGLYVLVAFPAGAVTDGEAVFSGDLDDCQDEAERLLRVVLPRKLQGV